jgi:hypothetical protein
VVTMKQIDELTVMFAHFLAMNPVVQLEFASGQRIFLAFSDLRYCHLFMPIFAETI